MSFQIVTYSLSIFLLWLLSFSCQFTKVTWYFLNIIPLLVYGMDCSLPLFHLLNLSMVYDFEQKSFIMIQPNLSCIYLMIFIFEKNFWYLSFFFNLFFIEINIKHYISFMVTLYFYFYTHLKYHSACLIHSSIYLWLVVLSILPFCESKSK